MAAFFITAVAATSAVAQINQAQQQAPQELPSQGGSLPTIGNFGNQGSGSQSRRNTSNFSSSQNSSTNRSVFSEVDRERNRNNASRGTPAANRRGQQQQSATGIQRREGRQQTRTLRGQATRAQGGGASRPAVVEFKMKANPNTNMLYLEGMAGSIPSLNIVAEEGTTFPVRVMFGNARASRVKDVEIALKFDGSLVQPMVIDDSSVAARFEGESQIGLDRRKGLLTYKARFMEPTSEALLELLRIEFQAIASASHTTLSFQNNDRARTALRNEDSISVLQLRDEDGEVVSSPRSGLLDASLSISPSATRASRLRDEDGTLRGITMAHAISEGSAVGGMQLSLSPRKTSARTGDDVLVDIKYNNPNAAELDSIKLRVIFDPRHLEVVDHDEGNWITKGINILDGPYQDELPFDFHRRNIAYNSRGEIQYDAGFNSRVRIPPSGTIATIRFRALQPIKSTAVAFSIDEERPERETSISFLGFNLIGSPGRRGMAVTDAILSVRP